jgi:two-component system response regulator VicR
MRILVCEDDILMLKIIEFALIKEGHEVIEASDGDQGIKILQEEKVDLLITDINLPYAKGLELVRFINTQLKPGVPVIIVSGITLDETRAHAMELGAKGYLTKPFDPAELVGMIDSLFAEY